jgi:hypothetical protein
MLAPRNKNLVVTLPLAPTLTIATSGQPEQPSNLRRTAMRQSSCRVTKGDSGHQDAKRRNEVLDNHYDLDLSLGRRRPLYRFKTAPYQFSAISSFGGEFCALPIGGRFRLDCFLHRPGRSQDGLS